MMRKIDKGQLRVVTKGQVYQFPDAPAKYGERTAEIRVLNDAFWLRLCLMGDLGFSEAYMYSEVECDDLVSLFQVRPPPASVRVDSIRLSLHRSSSTTARTSSTLTRESRISTPCHKS